VWLCDDVVRTGRLSWALGTDESDERMETVLDGGCDEYLLFP